MRSWRRRRRSGRLRFCGMCRGSWISLRRSWRRGCRGGVRRLHPPRHHRRHKILHHQRRTRNHERGIDLRVRHRFYYCRKVHSHERGSIVMVESAADFTTIRLSGLLNWRWVSLAALVCCAAMFVTGCGGRQPVASAPPVTTTTPEPAPPPEPTSRPAPSSPAAGVPKPHEGGTVFEEGRASWYGAPFNGRQASNGETYDMYKFTAAHRTLPFNTMVRVTNMTNGKSTTVRITDRGPFVDNRIIDLSYAAAKQIESIGPGVVRVQLEILSAIDPNDGTFTIQV